ncbi:zinc-binding protein A33-like isoform X1 [Seriola aureovittata]|uniref:zinc-binding protein A33-like isoform X1 n=1 Tax=Seriola aureovittata TaxID=2871759 RepID=UPI0024BDA7EF|nr:zinc-binding protein A33-like isoform X1 [Seriola aureovittata]
MSCQSPLPESLPGPEAEGLASPPWSVDSPERCEDHEESLSMFCLDDLEPLCKQCAAVSHAGHRVYLLAEAATDCKEELRPLLNGLKKKLLHFEKVTQTCEHASRHNQAEAKLTEEQMKKEFESLDRFLREEEAARILELRREQEERKRETEERVDRMDQVIKSLEDKLQLIEEELDAGGDGAEFLQQYQDTMNSAWMGHREPKRLCRPLIDVAKHLGNLHYAVWEKMKHIAPYTPVTLDPRTAGQSLRVSTGLNSLQITPGPSEALVQNTGEVVPVPANPERFHAYSCILARESFDSGVHCWDIEVGDTNNWTLGVAAESISRGAEFEACPEAGLWCISLRDSKYQALTTPSQTINFDNSRHLNVVRVRLDWDEGMLGFMNADNDAHLFTFRHRFAEKVYPYFESMCVCGGLAVLAESVGVTVGLNDDPQMKSESSTEGDIFAASTVRNSKMSDCGRVTEDKNTAICSQRSMKKDQLIKTKPTRKGKTSEGKPAVKKQSSKTRLSVTYHVSLSKALNIINNRSASHKQIQMDYVDNLKHSTCDE